MSRDELVQAYVEGGLSRRTFIRRLVAAGVSFGAAVSYAHLLDPGRAYGQARNPTDFHTPPQPTVDVNSRNIRAVVRNNGINVLLNIEEPALVQLIADATPPAKKPGSKLASAAKKRRRKRKPKVVGSLVIDCPDPGQRLVTIPLNAAGRKLFRRTKKKTTVFVSCSAIDRQGSTAQVLDRQKLKRKKKKRR